MNENLYDIPEDIDSAERKARELWQGYLEAEKLLSIGDRMDEKIRLICLAAKEYATKKSISEPDKQTLHKLETYQKMYSESQGQLKKALDEVAQLRSDKQLLEETIESFRQDKRALMRTIEIQVLGE